MSSNSKKGGQQRYGDLEIDDDDEVDRIVYDYHHKLTKKEEVDPRPDSNAPNPGYLLNSHALLDRIALESNTPSPQMSTAPMDLRLSGLSNHWQDVATDSGWMKCSGYLPIWSRKISTPAPGARITHHHCSTPPTPTTGFEVPQPDTPLPHIKELCGQTGFKPRALPHHLSYAGDVFPALREIEMTCTDSGILKNPKIPLIPEYTINFDENTKLNPANNNHVARRYMEIFKIPAPSFDFTHLGGNKEIGARFQTAGSSQGYYFGNSPPSLYSDIPMSPSGVKTSTPSRIPAATKRTASASATPHSGDHEPHVFHRNNDPTTPSTDLKDKKTNLTIGQSDSSPDSANEEITPPILEEDAELEPRASEISQPITRPLKIPLRRVVPCTTNSFTIEAPFSSNSKENENEENRSHKPRHLEILNKFVKEMDPINKELKALFKSNTEDPFVGLELFKKIRHVVDETLCQADDVDNGNKAGGRRSIEVSTEVLAEYLLVLLDMLVLKEEMVQYNKGRRHIRLDYLVDRVACILRYFIFVKNREEDPDLQFFNMCSILEDKVEDGTLIFSKNLDKRLADAWIVISDYNRTIHVGKIISDRALGPQEFAVKLGEIRNAFETGKNENRDEATTCSDSSPTVN